MNNKTTKITVALFFFSTFITSSSFADSDQKKAGSREEALKEVGETIGSGIGGLAGLLSSKKISSTILSGMGGQSGAKIGADIGADIGRKLDTSGISGSGGYDTIKSQPSGHQSRGGGGGGNLMHSPLMHLQ